MHETIILDKVSSTNSYIAERLLISNLPSLPSPTTVCAYAQTSGRGQRGNSWHAAAGMNLTLSTFFKPNGLPSSQAFTMNILASLTVMSAIIETLGEDVRKHLSVKWPNDVYYDDQKIAGILIEQSFTDRHVDYAIIGVGININEDKFPESLPNPISLYGITGEQYPIKLILEHYIRAFDGLAPLTRRVADRDRLLKAYLGVLYRRENEHRWRDADGEFVARISGIGPMGRLLLQVEGEEEVRRYTFKEVAYI